MILLLNTATPTCQVWLVDGESTYAHEWQADRELAHGLHAYLRDRLAEHGWSWQDIEGLGVFQGPGSFTGLRIGLTVCNTIASSAHIPIIGATGDEWREEVLERLRGGEDDQVVLPEYGGEAHITQPKK